MAIGVWQLLLILALAILFFGRDRIPMLMGDIAKGIKNFKKGMADDDNNAQSNEPKTIDAKVEKTVEQTSPETSKTS